ncbi:MAG: hypothetical protein ACI88A_005036, partial [Paraglaciecola sp.]
MENMDKRVKFAKEFFKKNLMHEDIKNDPGPSFNQMVKRGENLIEIARAIVENDAKVDT